MIIRQIESQIREMLFKGKAIVLIGPRQSGKTSLLQKIVSDYEASTLILDGDDPNVLKLLERPNTMQLKQLIGKHKIVFVDEAQRINDIGITSKIIVDQFSDVQLILSGSSAFDLNQQVHEPLTGRKITFYLYPISWSEWQDYFGYLKADQDLQNRLVFGFYPDVLVSDIDPNIILRELTDSYLYKDILMFGNVKKPEDIKKLLQALAYQVGSEVSLRELGETVGIDPKTVDRYISILEKAFVIFKLSPLSRNLRNEIKTNRKIYFYDNGIRNAIIGQLQPVPLRQDIGVLWENFIISERMKFLSNQKIFANMYFWRTAQQQEIDYVEELDGVFYANEIKWNPKKTPKFPKSFLSAYSPNTMIINRDNFKSFLSY
jgi:predicted AAA+ superfamily ATPase